MVIGRPTASSAGYPNSRSAPAFHETIRPSSVLLTIASSEDSTIAASRALASAERFSSLISRAMMDAPTRRPAASRMGETSSNRSRGRPSLLSSVTVYGSRGSSQRIRSRIAASSVPGAGRSSRVTRAPIASSAEYPNHCSAARFQEVTAPSLFWLMKAYSAESTIAVSNWPRLSSWASSSCERRWRNARAAWFAATPSRRLSVSDGKPGCSAPATSAPALVLDPKRAIIRLSVPSPNGFGIVIVDRSGSLRHGASLAARPSASEACRCGQRTKSRGPEPPGMCTYTRSSPSVQQTTSASDSPICAASYVLQIEGIAVSATRSRMARRNG
jgi:hypothetical protein